MILGMSVITEVSQVKQLPGTRLCCGVENQSSIRDHCHWSIEASISTSSSILPFSATSSSPLHLHREAVLVVTMLHHHSQLGRTCILRECFTFALKQLARRRGKHFLEGGFCRELRKCARMEWQQEAAGTSLSRKWTRQTAVTFDPLFHCVTASCTEQLFLLWHSCDLWNF